MSKTKPKIMFYVQHLLGVGHVFRATRIARGLARSGCETHVVWGGAQIESVDTTGLEMTYLDPVRSANENFKQLLHPDGSIVSEEEKHQRCQKLLATFEELKPDIVIIEAFPFGRRLMRFELLPLLDAVKNAAWKPMLVSSIRDIMQENRADDRVRESIELARDRFDLVMVHGDPDLIAIEDTLQGASQILHLFKYTGLVTPEPPDLAVSPSFSPDVLISAGGGAVGLGLMKLAVKSMGHSERFPGNWLVVTGPDLPQEEYDKLLNQAPNGMQIIRFLPDLARVMAVAKVSVSRAGYNTVGDVMRSGSHSVLVPFVGGGESEQLRRAQIMDERGVATMLEEQHLTPQRLGKGIDVAADIPVAAIDLDLDGANNAAEMLIQAHQSRIG